MVRDSESKTMIVTCINALRSSFFSLTQLHGGGGGETRVWERLKSHTVHAVH
jgi:hypothetical protein